MLSCPSRRTFLAQLATTAMLPGFHFAARAAASPASTLRTETPLDALVRQLKNTITEVMTRLDVPGLSVALLRDAKVAWTGEFGVKDKETGAAVDDATVFEAASLTKPLLAYGALALCEQNRLDLDQPLAELLHEPFTDQQPELLAQVTARHVLTHTTGFPNWRIRGRPLKFLRPPGEKFSYSGEGFVYLQKVVEQLTGAPLDEYLQKKLFGPLGMESASLVWKDEFEQTLARGYDRRGRTSPSHNKWVNASAASSLICTAADYAKFVCALLTPHKATGDLLALCEVAPMYKPHVEATKGVSWGLGLGVEHTPDGDALWHWGNNGNRYMSFVVAFPRERLGLVVMTNSGAGLKACAEIVPAAIGGDHPALRWRMVVG